MLETCQVGGGGNLSLLHYFSNCIAHCGGRDACCLTTDCQRDQQQAHHHDGQGTNVVIVCEKVKCYLHILKRNVHKGR